MSKLARKIAARWIWQNLSAGWQPPMPSEIQKEFLRRTDWMARQGYMPDTPDLVALDDARDSVGVFLPKILKLLHDTQHDRYYVNASESQGHIFYFFAPRQPVDAFNLTIATKGPKVLLSFGYTPYGPNGHLDLQNMISEKQYSDPEVAGLAVMRLVRTVLSRI